MRNPIARVCLVLGSVIFISTTFANENPLDDLLDNKLEGLFVGGGFEYGTKRLRLSFSDERTVSEIAKAELATLSGTSGNLQWRIGYATSEHIAFYLTSLASNLEPSLGVMMFSKKYRGYFNALIGYSSFGVSTFEGLPEDISTASKSWNFGLGIGREFRPHLMGELTFGYSRLTVPVIDRQHSPYGLIAYTETFDMYLDKITVVVSFNYLFY